MFKELAPLLRQRAVLLTVTRLEEDEIRVNIIPKKLNESENNALTTALKVTGTAEELDRDLPSAIVSYVSSHLQLKGSLERAQAEMDAAAKAAQAEARAKAKTLAKKDSPKPADLKSAVTAKPAEIAKPGPPKPAGLFDTPVPTIDYTPDESDSDQEDEILAEADASSYSEDDELEDAA